MAFEEFFTANRRQLEDIYQASGAARWSVPLADFAQTAWKGIASAAGAEPSEIPNLISSLRSDDMALALGCARGNEQAWDIFCSKFRSILYDAAYAIVHEEVEARELSESLLAELYGLDGSSPGRGSRFAYFHGRSSLKTWLRAVLHQRFVDEYRRTSRLVQMPEDPPEVAETKTSVSEEEDRRYAECLGDAVEASLNDAPADEKLLLGYYYVQELTLKQIGRLSGEHEATISRRLEAVRKKLRKRIEAYLRNVKKLSAFELDRCLDFASRGVIMNMERVLKPK